MSFFFRMAFIKVAWFEPIYDTVQRGIIPACWVQNYDGVNIVRWPNTQDSTPFVSGCIEPEINWRVYILVERLSETGKNKYIIWPFYVCRRGSYGS